VHYLYFSLHTHELFKHFIVLVLSCLISLSSICVRVSDAGINLSDNEPVAIKLESARCRFPQLAYEYKLYKILQAGGMLF
jgi:hypothetical protein